MKNDKYLREFKVNLTSLSAADKKLMVKLVEVVRLVAPLYAQQVNSKYPGANFYPHDASREEIEKAAHNNPDILSPYTVVERQNGQLVAIPYHVKYQKALLPISRALHEAAALSDGQMSRYLKATAEALLAGDYDEIDKYWLSLKNYNIDILIGPFERYVDKLFFIKRAYQGYLGLVNRQLTKLAQDIRDVLYNTIENNPDIKHRIIPLERTQVSAIDNIAFSGFLAESLFSQEHFPCNEANMEKYGARIIIYASSLKYKFDNLLYPIFQSVFEKRFQSGYSRELLEKANSLYVLVRGIAQQMHRYQGARERLKELFPIIDEANSPVSGIQHCKHLIMKGVISQKELEAIIITHICWMFSEWVLIKKTQTRSDYLHGDALVLGFYLTEGALRLQDGISWPNFSKIFFEIERLSLIFVRLITIGDYQEAKDFFDKYLKLSVFDQLAVRLTKIKPI